MPRQGGPEGTCCLPQPQSPATQCTTYTTHHHGNTCNTCAKDPFFFYLSVFAFHYKSNRISLKKILKIRKHRKIKLPTIPSPKHSHFLTHRWTSLKPLFLSIFSLKNISDAPSRRPQVFTSEDFCQDVDCCTPRNFERLDGKLIGWRHSQWFI